MSDQREVTARTRQAYGQSVTEQIARGDWEVTTMIDAAASVPASRERDLERLAKRIAEATENGKRPYVIVVCEVRPTREQLERSILELRGALEDYASDESGWAESSHADAYEASRVLVPDQEVDEDTEPPAPATAKQVSQADFYPRSRYGPRYQGLELPGKAGA